MILDSITKQFLCCVCVCNSVSVKVTQLAGMLCLSCRSLHSWTNRDDTSLISHALIKHRHVATWLPGCLTLLIADWFFHNAFRCVLAGLHLCQTFKEMTLHGDTDSHLPSGWWAAASQSIDLPFLSYIILYYIILLVTSQKSIWATTL